MEMMNKPINKDEICNVCLSTDRTLTPLGKYLKLFTKICKLKPTYRTRNLLICWECNMLLRKVKAFQEKVSKAQSYFKNVKSMDTNKQCNTNYSTLQIVLNTDINYYFTETNANANEIIDCDIIKKEYEDTKCNESYLDECENIEAEILEEKKCNESYLEECAEKADAENIEIEIKAEKMDINQEFLNNLLEIDDVKDEFDNDYDDFLYLENFKKKKAKKVRKKPKTKRQRSYRVVYNDIKEINFEGSNLDKYKLLPIDFAELESLRKKEKTMNYYTKMEYKCETCIVGYLLKTTYLKHMEKHDKSLIYECDICTQRFKAKSHLSKHLSAHLNKYVCQLCGATYLRAYNMMRHIKTDHQRAYQCLRCGDRFKCQSEVQKHFNSHRKFVCDHCGKKSNSKSVLEKHMIVKHLPHICKICNITFKTSRCRSEHIKAKHVKTRTEEAFCVECNMQFDNVPVYKRHLHTSVKHIPKSDVKINHMPYICKICNITYKNYKNLKRHNNVNHVSARTDEAFCVECNIQFDNVSKYKTHLKYSIAHNPKSDIKYPCPECKKLFTKKMSMKYHYSYFHTDRTKFYCERCEKYFLNSYQLRRHKLVFHDKIKPVKNKFCPHCGRGFSERRILENHIRTHTGERPYACSMCAAAFTQPWPLTIHMRSVHKVAKPDVCDNKFLNKE